MKKRDNQLNPTNGLDSAAAARLISLFRGARRSHELTVLEGLHPVKHALRFGAEIEHLVTGDLQLLTRLCQQLAPDIEQAVTERVMVVEPEVFAQLAPVPPDSGVMAISRRRPAVADELLKSHRQSPLILLEQPSHLGNIGAVVRVAAAAGASGVITTGRNDPWHPTAVKGGAGLQYALPVGSLDEWPDGGINGPLWGLHPEGDPLQPGLIPDEAILVFGSERRGLSEEMLRRVDHKIAIPMAPGVSSLNLATAVAVALYTWRLWRAERGS